MPRAPRSAFPILRPGFGPHAHALLLDIARFAADACLPCPSQPSWTMSWHVWLAFLASSMILAVVPGPGAASIVGYAIGSGRRTALAAVAGLAAGDTVAITLSLAGVGTLLAASATAFLLLKWIGALYLVSLGMLTLLRSRSVEAEAGNGRRATDPRAAFLGSVAVGAFHPKTIIFFVAFVPQFINPRGSYATQAIILSLTFCMTAVAVDTAYALAASGAWGWLRRPGTLRWSERICGGVLIAAGVATAAARH